MNWYSGNIFYDTVLLAGFGYALLILLSSFFGTASYGGRFSGKSKKGIKLGSKQGWVLMEIPSLIAFPIIFFLGSKAFEPVPLVFLAIWLFHYSNRALINPMLMRVQPGSSSTFSLNVVVAGWVTLLLHSYLNAAYISEIGSRYSPQWLQSPQFIAGLLIYIAGFTLNVHSDAILRNLRSPNPSPDEPRYKIPYGGAFKYVSSPQYLGEILSFCGFAVMTWNLGAVFVLAVTMANLVPRAIYTHKWYLKTFADYPKNRKAIVPYLF